MRFVSSVRTFSLGLATASVLLAGSALAQENNNNHQQGELVGVDARLDQALSSKTARAGEVVTAMLDQKAKTPEGVDLPKGTELKGQIDVAQSSENGGPAKISLIFNQAQLKDGKTLPVHVILLGAFPPNQESRAIYGQEEMGPAPHHVNPRESVDQKAGLLSHVSMHSDMHGHDSATFIRKNGDFDLHRGTYLQIGIAPRDSGAMINGAE